MNMIVGLGNPGEKYEGTRHNVGFQVLDELARRLNISFRKQKFQALYAEDFVRSSKHLFVKPQTYMNLSGQAVRPLADYFGISDDRILVIYDDLDLEVGHLRFRLKGGAGGHNGMKDIIQSFGHQDLKRIRIGIGRPLPQQTVTQHVLGRFTVEEQALIEESVQQAADAVEFWLAGHSFEETMSKHTI